MYDANQDDLAGALVGQPPFRVRQVHDALYRQGRTFAEMTDLPAAVRDRLAAALPEQLSLLSRQECDGGTTVKWLWALHDGAAVESVLMVYRDRVTVCVSSQAGCAMGCTFCATGQAGFTRHLSAGEIVAQVMAATREARPRRLSHVVFMGMGEPLANFGAVMAAVERLTADVGLSARHLTVSTVGVLPGIRRLTESEVPVNLAVSLHAARDELRDELVPLNRRYPLAALSETCADYVERSGRRLSLEWALIAGVNDAERDVDELAAFARPLRAHVNVIPLNPTPGYPMPGSDRARVRAFTSSLRRAGVNVTVRDTRGVEIDAACGQLAAQVGKVAIRPGGRRA